MPEITPLRGQQRRGHAARHLTLHHRRWRGERTRTMEMLEELGVFERFGVDRDRLRADRSTVTATTVIAQCGYGALRRARRPGLGRHHLGAGHGPHLASELGSDAPAAGALGRLFLRRRARDLSPNARPLGDRHRLARRAGLSGGRHGSLEGSVAHATRLNSADKAPPASSLESSRPRRGFRPSRRGRCRRW